MNLGKGFLFAAGLATAVAGCAGGGGGAPATTAPGPAAQAVPQQSSGEGERPREDQYTRAAQDYLDDAFGMEALGQAAQAQAAYENAVAQAELAVQSNPTNPRAHMVLGEAYLAVERYREAGEAYARALELRPAYAEETRTEREQAWMELYSSAAPLVNSGEYEEAMDIFAAADAIYEDRPEVKIILGQLLAQEGEYDRAIQLLEEADALIEGPRIEEVDSATAANWRRQQENINPTIAQALLMSERYQDAIPFLRGLLDEEPTNVQYALGLATSYRETDQLDQARALLTEVASQQGLTARNYLNLGIELYQLEDYLPAADAFERAAEASPNHRDALEFGVNSLQLHYVSGERETPEADARRWHDMAQRWKELDPANPQAYAAIAQAMNRLDDLSGAGELMNTAESLPVTVQNLQMTVSESEALVAGDLARGTTEAATATLRITFYDTAGNSIGTEEVTVDVPLAEGATTRLHVTFAAPPGAEVDGYGYDVVS